MAFYRDANGNVVDSEKAQKVRRNEDGSVRVSGSGIAVARVFGYLGVALLITAGISLGLGVLFYNLFGSGEAVAESAATTYIIIMIISAIGVLVSSILVNFVAARGKMPVLVPGLIYVVCMGVLLSTFTIFIDWRVLGIAFGITAGTFLIMALIALLSKGNMNGLAIVGIGLLVGSLILGLTNWLLAFLLPEVWTWLMWIITFVTFGAMILITIFDIWRIKKIAEQGEMSTNLELYLAFQLYVDFIYIFIRVLYFVLIILSKGKK